MNTTFKLATGHLTVVCFTGFEETKTSPGLLTTLKIRGGIVEGLLNIHDNILSKLQFRIRKIVKACYLHLKLCMPDI